MKGFSLTKLGMLLFAIFGSCLALQTVRVMANQGAPGSPDCVLPIYEEQRSTGGFGGGGWRTVTVGYRIDPACLKDDSRLNANDRAAGVVIYCLPDQSIAVYDVDIRGEGQLALAITQAQLADFPAVPSDNTLIGDAGGIRLYRLTSGELQVNAPGIYPDDPEYVFIWSGC